MLSASNYKSKFRINPTALLVEGASRSLICDVERGQYFFIPESLFYILKDAEVKTIDDIIIKYAGNDCGIIETISDYFNFLVKEDLIFFSEFIDYYQDIELEWDFPGLISNSIIDFGVFNTEHITAIASQLDELNCRFLQLRFFHVINQTKLEIILNHFDLSVIEGIDIYVQYLPHFQEALENLVLQYPRINNVVL